MEQKTDLKMLGIGFGVGIIIGGIIGLLYAPMKGEVLRAEVVKKVRDIHGKFIKSKVDKVHQ